MNTLKTTVLMALLMGIMIAVGGAFGGRGGAMLMLIISLGFNFVTYWFSDSIVLKMYDAREVDGNSAPELYGLVERLQPMQSCLCQGYILLTAVHLMLLQQDVIHPMQLWLLPLV